MSEVDVFNIVSIIILSLLVLVFIDIYRTPEIYTPDDLGFEDFPYIKKIVIGKCVWGNKWETHELAHTHVLKTICVRKKSYLYNLDKSPSDILWHEYAHVLTPDDVHGPKWAATLAHMGKFHIIEAQLAGNYNLGNSGQLIDFPTLPEHVKIFSMIGNTVTIKQVHK